MPAVWRERERGRIAGWRLFDLKANRERVGRRFAHMERSRNRQYGHSNECGGSDAPGEALATRAPRDDRYGYARLRGRGFLRGRIVIPIHDEHGELIAYVGRA